MSDEGSQISRQIRERFPQRLAAFERMMIVDDRDDYPMLAEVELHFSGKADLDALADSLVEAVARHPLLYARLGSGWLDRMQWVLPPGDALAVDLQVLDSQDEAQTAVALTKFRSRIDLTKNPGLRLLICKSTDGIALHIGVHHACCDGSGVFQFIRDVLLIYHRRQGGDRDATELSAIDHSLLKRRGHFAVHSETWTKLIQETAFGFKLAKRFGNEKPVMLSAASGEEPSSPDQTVSSPANDFTDLLRPLRRSAARAAVTVNDLMVRDLFLSVLRWNTMQGDTDHRDDSLCYRVMMPCSLRTADHEHMSAGNSMSFSFLSRTEADLQDEDELLRGIKEETQYIRDTNASLYFIRSLQVASWIPRGMSVVAEANKCMATSLLSNIADPLRCIGQRLPNVNGRLQVGELVLEKIDARPPLRPHTRIGLVVNSYANQLILGTAFDRNFLPIAAAEDFLHVYRSHLEETVASYET